MQTSIIGTTMPTGIRLAAPDALGLLPTLPQGGPFPMPPPKPQGSTIPDGGKKPSNRRFEMTATA